MVSWGWAMETGWVSGEVGFDLEYEKNEFKPVTYDETKWNIIKTKCVWTESDSEDYKSRPTSVICNVLVRRSVSY